MKTKNRYFVFTILILTTLACNFTGIIPTDEPPGVGEKADKGYAFSEPIIKALDQYKTDHGTYPEKLDELVPGYLPTKPSVTEELEYSYSGHGDTYSFSFHYRGPGLNTCTYKPGEDWKCSGAY